MGKQRMATLLSVPAPRNKIARITKKNDRFNKQNNNSARPSDIFFYYFTVTTPLRSEISLLNVSWRT